MTQDILFARENHIGIVTLNRAQALNALTFPMIVALQQQLQAWQEDDAIHAVVVCAAGDRAFCAGGDVRAIYNLGPAPDPQKMDFFGQEYHLNQFIHDFPKPYIAMMDGITMGGGVGISLHGSHPVASERFVFAMPETGIGFYPDIGASHLLSNCLDHFGVYLGLTGSRLNATDAHALGLVKHIIPSEQFTVVLASLIETDLSADPMQRVSDVLETFSRPVSSVGIDAIAPWVNACFQHSDMESILAALDNNTTNWHRNTRDVLAKKSPLSLKVTLAQLQKAKLMSLAACLQMDYCLTWHFMHDHDFFEGVRALLVDKDNTPHWQPQTLGEATESMVSAYFRSCSPDNRSL